MAGVPQPGASWRDSARSPRFFMIDALAAIPLVFFFLHIRLWTFLTAIAVMIFFGVIEKFNFTLPIFIRFVKSQIAGKVRVANSEWRR